MTTTNRLPEPPARQDADPVAYGAALLAFLLATSCTATLDDDQLESAAYAARYAIAARTLSTPGADRLGDALHLIARTLQQRKLDSRAPADLLPVAAPLDTRPPEGPMARLQPQPFSHPPSGQKVEILF